MPAVYVAVPSTKQHLTWAGSIPNQVFTAFIPASSIAQFSQSNRKAERLLCLEKSFSIAANRQSSAILGEGQRRIARFHVVHHEVAQVADRGAGVACRIFLQSNRPL